MITHTEENLHKCAQCGYSFDLAGNLKQHLLIHSGEKPQKCPQCDHASSYAAQLRDHIRSQINANSAITLQSQSQILPNMCSPQWREVTSLHYAAAAIVSVRQ